MRKSTAYAVGAAVWFAMFSLTTTLAVVSEDTLPAADWISTSSESAGPQTAFFRHHFTSPPGLVKAVLLGACDQSMTVLLNGREAAEIRGHERAVSVGITKHIQAGHNVIAVRVANERGLAAFRLMIELATDQGRQHWVVSNASWKASLAEVPDWFKTDFTAADWTAAFGHGEAGMARWGNAFAATKSVDAYNSWMLARGASHAAGPETITTAAGFRVELLRSAQPDEDSWIALAFDPQGRITIAREKRGLLRLTMGAGQIESVEVIEDTLLECRGLLYAFGALYVNANNSKGFYRLRDTDGDDRFDEKLLLLTTRGGVGHGRNQLRLGPDERIYLVHGNDVELPANVDRYSPLRHFENDQLFPERWGEHGSTDFVRPPHGHILATDRDGKSWRLVAGGLRNALDVAFNEDGEMFTYDADNERDLAAPWYKPTRVLHIIPGGEYGWRPGAGKWPAYLPDTLPSVVDIGIGSPCGVEFGTESHFPDKWRRALFIADWAYGRIVAIHLTSRGASYQGKVEPFVSGRPLNVTDFAFGADGAMYFVTGGRGTQSGLYRVTYVGPANESSERSEGPNAKARRAERTALEALQSTSRRDAIPAIWPRLGHADHFIRYAARVALEAQPLHEWQEKALGETDITTLLNASLALVRVAPNEVGARLVSRLANLDVANFSSEQNLLAVRIHALHCMRAGQPRVEIVEAITRQLEPIYPSTINMLDHELCRLLVYLRSPQVLDKTITLLAAARTSADLLHYLWHLRHLREGWTLEQRSIAFAALARAEQLQGARDYLAAVRLVRTEFIASLTPDDRKSLAAVLAPKTSLPPRLPTDMSKYQFTQAWTMRDFANEALSREGSVAGGREAFAAAQCVLCHRAAGEPGASIGPDLTGVSARFGRRELLEHILEPSKVIDDKFRSVTVTMKDGTVYAGTLEYEEDLHLVLNTGSGADALIEIERSRIADRQLSDTSPMPSGLLNNLSMQQIADLLAYLGSGTALPSVAN